MFKKMALTDVVEVDSIITLHYFNYCRDFKFAGESHDFWEMVFIDNGNVTVLAEDTELILEKGEAIFHKPGEYHSIWANDTYAGVVIITFGTQSQSMEYLTHGKMTLNADEEGLISEILKEAILTFAEPLDIVDQVAIIKRADAPFGAEQMIKNRIEQLLISLIRKHLLTYNAPQLHYQAVSEDEFIVSTIMKILEDNLYGNLLLDDISAQMNFSKSYIKTRFKKATGFGIHQMYIQMKISHSKKLLSEEKYSISEISEMLGFSSVHHFSRVFKQFTGIPPRIYAKSVRKRALL